MRSDNTGCFAIQQHTSADIVGFGFEFEIDFVLLDFEGGKNDLFGLRKMSALVSATDLHTIRPGIQGDREEGGFLREELFASDRRKGVVLESVFDKTHKDGFFVRFRSAVRPDNTGSFAIQ